MTSTVADTTMVTPYDSLIVAAGASTSYFGNDRFELDAPGLKSIDDALELRGKIFGAFELAEIETDPAVIEELLTFVVVGAGADRRRDGRPDLRAGAPDAAQGVPQHRHPQGPDHPGRRHVDGAGNVRHQAVGARGQAAQAARHRGLARQQGRRRRRSRPVRRRRAGQGGPHQLADASSGRRASRRPRSAASSPSRPAPRSTAPAGSWSSRTARCPAIRRSSSSAT